jgi:protein-disulfide isomerase
MDKRFWAIIGIIVVVFGGIIFVSQHKSNNEGTTSSAKPTQHVEGNKDAKVTLVEYGDYECPVCENYYQAVQQTQAKYNDTVQFQFRNLPLVQIHPNAFAGARAAEAADMQGNFWEMNALLYNPSNWKEWSVSNNASPYFEQYAKELHLNITKFKKDFASLAVNNRINADIAAFNKTKQQMATPAFFVNGTFVANTKLVDDSGQPSVEAFSKLLDAELKKAGVTPPATAPQQ